MPLGAGLCVLSEAAAVGVIWSATRSSRSIQLTRGDPNPPNAHDGRTIHTERLNRRSTDWRFRRQSPVASPPKMVAPPVLARMEQPNELPRPGIQSRASRRFFQRTRNARQRKVVLDRLAAVRTWLNVVDVKSCFLRPLRQLAILSPLFGASDHTARKGHRNRLPHGFLC